VAPHARAATDGTLLDRPAARSVERCEGMLGRDMESVDVVQAAVVRLGNDRERPEEGGITLAIPGNDGIPHNPDTVRVGDQDRPFEEARVLDPRGAGHLTVSIETEPGSEGRVTRESSPRQDRGDTRPDRALPHNELPVTLDDRRMADLDSSHIGDRIVRPGLTLQPNAERTGIGDVLSGSVGCQDSHRAGRHTVCDACHAERHTDDAELGDKPSYHYRPARFFT